MTSRLTPTLNSRSAASTASALIRVDAPPPTVDARPLVSVVHGSGLLPVSESACHHVWDLTLCLGHNSRKDRPNGLQKWSGYVQNHHEAVPSTLRQRGQPCRRYVR